MSLINSLEFHLVFDGILIKKKTILYDEYSKWSSIDDMVSVFHKENFKIKYFDEENEPISINESEDFLCFQNIIIEKKFVDNRVTVVIYDDSFDWKKYNNLSKFLSLKLQGKKTESFSRTSNFTIQDSSSSSSRSPERYKSRKSRSRKKYAAEIRKELNYLPGSEVSDGQTINKKWRVKNIGTKQWKLGSVKCVLLPSEFSDWITYEIINVPSCVPEQKVDIELEIRIIGKWTEERLRLRNCCQIIKLRWLLFIDKIIEENEAHFMDYILSILSLTINVKNRESDTTMSEIIESNLKKQTSESSIEKIDQDFSLVNLTDEEESKQSPFENTNMVESNVIVKDSASEVDIDLPELPNNDDFQITDFNQPNNYISGELNDVKALIMSSNNYPIFGKPEFTPEEEKLFLIDEKKEEILTQKDTIKNVKKEEKEISKEDNFETESTSKEDDKIENENTHGNIYTIVNDIHKCETNNETKDTNIDPTSQNSREEIETNNETKDAIINSTSQQSCEDLEINNESNPIKDVETKIENEILDEKLRNEDKKHSLPVNLDVNITSNVVSLENDDNKLNPSNVSSSSNLVNSSNDQNMVFMGDFRENHNTHLINNPVGNNIPLNPNRGFRGNPNGYHQSTNSNTEHNPNLNTNEVFRGNPMNRQQFPYNGQPQYRAGVNYVGNSYIPVVPNAPPVFPVQMPVNNCYTNVQYPNLPYSAGVCPPYPISNQPIQNQSSNEIIQKLARSGYIHNNINDVKWAHDPNGKHYEFSLNLQKLYDMGFTDRERNERILIKFQNNLDDAIQELIDD